MRWLSSLRGPRRRGGRGGAAAGVLAVAVAAALLGGTSARPAAAITGGEPDGDRHPAVALIAASDGAGVFRCSATLVSPTVLLTAAHCTSGVVGEVAVTFRSDISASGPRDTWLPDPEGPDGGFAGTEGDGWLWGTPYTHPDYSDFTDLDTWNDVGVVVLDTPVEGIAPQRIAPVGTLDALAQPVLNKTAFTFVGYGTEVRKPVSGPQKPQPMSYPLLRRTTTSPGQKLTAQVLQVNGNPNDTRGGGGTCSGDSGGPGYYQGQIVTVTSYGYTENCRYLGGNQRVDIPAVQEWLAGFGVEAAGV